MLFKDKAKAAPKNIPELVKAVNKKKRFFTDPSKIQNLQIVLSRLTDAPSILIAVNKLKTTMLTHDKLSTLIENWPSDEID